MLNQVGVKIKLATELTEIIDPNIRTSYISTLAHWHIGTLAHWYINCVSLSHGSTKKTVNGLVTYY